MQMTIREGLSAERVRSQIEKNALKKNRKLNIYGAFPLTTTLTKIRMSQADISTVAFPTEVGSYKKTSA
jgi:hypothetical protein